MDDQIFKFLQDHQDIEISMKYIKDYGIKIHMYKDNAVDSKIFSYCSYDVLHNMLPEQPDLISYLLDALLTELEAYHKENK